MLAFQLMRTTSPVRSGQGDQQWPLETPKIVEVPVGMEINMYACAVRK